MRKFIVNETDIFQLKYLFALYELIAKMAERKFVLFAKGMRCDNTKMYISANLYEAMRKRFIRKEFVNSDGFQIMMKNAGPQLDENLPDNTVMIQDDFFASV